MFVGHLVQVFRLVHRVMRDDGTLWINFGDSYAGSGKGAANYPGDYPKQNSNIGSLGNKGLPVAKLSNGLKPKDLVGIPWRVAFALQADGWYLRIDNIWSKPNPMPESVIDRPTKSHEYIFLLSKSPKYYYDCEAIKEPLADASIARLSQDTEKQVGSTRAVGKTNGNMKAVGGSKGAFGPEQSRRRSSGNKDRKHGIDCGRPDNHLGRSIPWEGEMRNKRSVWTLPTAKMKESHFATFPEKLIEPCILAGCPVGGSVIDPFGGSGTTRKVALQNNRECTLIEQNPIYVEIAKSRTAIIQPNLIL